MYYIFFFLKGEAQDLYFVSKLQKQSLIYLCFVINGEKDLLSQTQPAFPTHHLIVSESVV